MTKFLRSAFGLTNEWTDSRPAHLSLAIGRIAIFTAVLWVHSILVDALLRGDFATFVAERTHGSYYPAGLLLLFGDTPPRAIFFEITRWASFVGAICAVVGFLTRPAMIAAIVGTWLLALLDLSRYEMWSHPYHPVLLAGAAFMFVQAGSSFSIDRLLHRKFGWPLGDRSEPVLWGVISAQFAVALFIFGAFWAKVIVSNYGVDYIFSDNMRNILAVTWVGYNEVAIPWYIALIASMPWLWMAVSAIHLLMQGSAIAAFFSTNHPWARLVEGLIFVTGAIGLKIFMTVSNPWWLLLSVLFVDWDYFVAKLKRTASQQAMSPMPQRKKGLILGSMAVLVMSTIAFLSPNSNSWRLYPFDQLNMYAQVYASAPINGHTPYAHVLRGQMAIEVPDGFSSTLDNADSRWRHIDGLEGDELNSLLPKISRKSTINTPVLYRISDGRIRFSNIPDIFHLLSRQKDIDRIKGGMDEFLAFAGPLPVFPAGSRLVLRRQDIAYQPYPALLNEKKVLHEGATGVMDIQSREFYGLVASSDDGKSQIKVETRGSVSPGKVMFRPLYPEGIRPVDAVELPGEWISPTEYQYDRSNLQTGALNTLIEGITPLGAYAFDGPIIY